MSSALALALLLCLAPDSSAQEGSELAPVPRGGAFLDLIQRLERENWVPPYFPSRVMTFDAAGEERRLREMSAEPYTMMKVGLYAYRISPKRVEEGKRLFFLYDFGSAEYWKTNERYTWYASGAATAEDLRRIYGILLEPKGHLVGVVGVPSPDGRTDYGWSCALCHAGAGPDGAPVPGAPNHRYDIGALRHRALVEHEPHPDYGSGYVDRDIPLERLKSLGGGRMDRNGDRIENPVKIPALWGLREARRGIYCNGSAANLWFAMGGHNGGVYPPSEYLEALVAFLLMLEPPPNPRPRGEAEARGEEVFRRAQCQRCHSGPYQTSGEVIPIEQIGTDPRRVELEFPKAYRVPTLRRLDLSRLFLHDGSVSSLPDLLRKERPGGVKGHLYGVDLTQEEKQDLVAYLLSL